MNPQNLSSVQALQPGAEIWIIPAPSESAWAARVDWYLNFQVSRGLKNKAISRSSVLEKLLTKIKWSLPAEFAVDQSPLLIAPMGRLPASWVLVPESWEKIEHLMNPIKGLKATRIRFFPPNGFPTDKLKTAKLGSDCSIEVVSPTER